MKEYNFFAFHPERFDPRTEALPKDEPIRTRIHNISPHPPKDNRALAQLGTALEQWAHRQDTSDVHDAHAIELYSEDWHSDYTDKDARFFYLQMLPSENLDDFYHTMITTANRLGLIVYCDLNEGLYYPDGSSDPAFLYPNLIAQYAKSTQPAAVTFSQRKRLPQYDKEVTPLLKPMLRVVLDQLGMEDVKIRYSGGCWMAKIPWQDATVELSARVENAYLSNRMLLVAGFYVQPKAYKRNKSYKALYDAKDTDIYFRLDDLGLMGIVWGLKEFRVFNALRDNDYSHEEAREIIGNYRSGLGVSTEGELYQCVHDEVTEIISWLSGYDSLYALYDDIYQNQQHPLHDYFWAAPFQRAHLDTIDYYSRHQRSLLLARFLQHPELLQMVEQWQVFEAMGIDAEPQPINVDSRKERLANFCRDIQQGYVPRS